MKKELVFLTKNPLKFNYHQVLEDSHFSKTHTHEGLQLIYVHEGTGYIKLHNCVYKLTPKTLIILQPFQYHEIIIDKDSSYIRTVFLINPQHLLTYVSSLPQQYLLISALIKYPLEKQVFSLEKEADEIENLLFCMNHTLSKCSSKEYSELYCIYFMLLLQILKNHIIYTYNLEHSSYIISILDWVEENISNTCTLHELTKHMNLSSSYLCHIVKESLGISLSQYIDKRRLEYVIVMLCSTNEPLKNIGLKVGFSDPTYFSNWFKKHTGCTPSSYRKSNKQNYSMSLNSEMKI